jgi:hypothetical protein
MAVVWVVAPCANVSEVLRVSVIRAKSKDLKVSRMTS